MTSDANDTTSSRIEVEIEAIRRNDLETEKPSETAARLLTEEVPSKALEKRAPDDLKTSLDRIYEVQQHLPLF